MIYIKNKNQDYKRRKNIFLCDEWIQIRHLRSIKKNMSTYIRNKKCTHFWTLISTFSFHDSNHFFIFVAFTITFCKIHSHRRCEHYRFKPYSIKMRITIKIPKGVILSFIAHRTNFTFVTIFKPPMINILFISKKND